MGPEENVLASLTGMQLGRAGSDFVIVEWTDSGASDWDWIAPFHVHHGDDEAWYVLEGVLRFRVGDEEFEIGAGGAVMAPKGTPHAYGNARRGEATRYLLVITPRIRALVDALHQPEAHDYAEIFRAYDSELLSWTANRRGPESVTRSPRAKRVVVQSAAKTSPRTDAGL